MKSAIAENTDVKINWDFTTNLPVISLAKDCFTIIAIAYSDSIVEESDRTPQPVPLHQELNINFLSVFQKFIYRNSH
ncbi:MAG TPA: hypothetical protein VIQ31_29445 [Phormidium sp.]